jgi:transcriptional regulator with XRE-family HTH domain
LSKIDIFAVMMLKQWRLSRGYTLSEAAGLLAIENARTYQRYEEGENRPDAPIVERILATTSGEVTLDDMHALRIQWLRANKPEIAGAALEAAE